MVKRTNISLPDEVARMLEGVDNLSGWVAAVAEYHTRRGAEAYRCAVEAGLSQVEIGTVAKVVSTWWGRRYGDGPEALQEELRRSEYAEVLASVIGMLRLPGRQADQLAQALLDIADEVRLGTPAVKREVE